MQLTVNRFPDFGCAVMSFCVTKVLNLRRYLYTINDMLLRYLYILSIIDIFGTSYVLQLVFNII